MNKIIIAVLILLGSTGMCVAEEPTNITLITNASIFDGQNENLKKGYSVLIEGNIIKQIASKIEAPSNAKTIDAKGATLMPGIIGAHEHVMFQVHPIDQMTEDARYLAYVATRTAKQYLMNGWTSIRDASGNTFSLKRAIQRGIIPGPRIFPSGAMISQTSGHSDTRLSSNPSSFAAGRPSLPQLYGDVVVADGESEILKATREQLRLGATQIKIAVGGSVNPADPIDVIELTDEEIQAAVKAATDFNTYVMSHVYSADGVKRAIKNGVKSIEHGNMIDKESMKLVVENDIWLSPQIMGFLQESLGGYSKKQVAELKLVSDGIGHMFELAKEMNYDKIVFGTDIVNSPSMIVRINEEFTRRTKWFSNFEVLKQATHNSGQLLGMSKRNNPGTLGVIEEDALADILLVNGNPLEDISIMTQPDKNLLLIMKDGKVFKNILEED